MHFLFSLLRIRAFTFFENYLFFIRRRYTTALGIACVLCQLPARNIPSAACAVAPEDEQVMLETCRGH
jgi:hypothetical protein